MRAHTAVWLLLAVAACPQAAVAAPLTPCEGQSGPPPEEAQIVLSRLWQRVHGEGSDRPKVLLETSLPLLAKTLDAYAQEGWEEVKSGAGKGLDWARQRLPAGWERKATEALDRTKQKVSELRPELEKRFKKWQRKAKQVYDEWARDNRQYKAKIDRYRQVLAATAQVVKNEISVQIRAMSRSPAEKIFVVPGSMAPPIRDQSLRGTCASFAGVRLLEVLLQQNKGKAFDLSEQYFYWSSRSPCQRSPCEEEGSRFIDGFDFSSAASLPNIPFERDCPYVSLPQPANTTQTPLAESCQRGQVKVVRFRQLSDACDDILAALGKNQPVAAAFELSENFYNTTGLVTQTEASRSTRRHSGGHAVVLVGYMTLPSAMAATEGKGCFIVANSWGEGWGIGGYACLTEQWVIRHARSHFAVVDAISVASD